jgi:hypothetical protein
MMKLMLVVGTMVVVAGCAGSTEDSTASLTSAVSAASSSSGSDERGQHRGPPPEAFTACEGKAAGDACTMTHEEQSIAGTCVSPPADAPDARILCRPEHMPEGGAPPGAGNCRGKPEDGAPSGS